MRSSPLLTQPVFVVGVPRSGTTLLSSLLSTSAELVMAPELHLLTTWRAHYSFLDLSTPRDVVFFIDKFLESERFALLDLPVEPVRSRVLALDHCSFAAILAVLLDEYRAAKSGTRVGEKTPGQFLRVSELLDFFPDACIIWMVRDPRAVISSLLRVPFSSPFIGHKAQRWNLAKQLEGAQDSRVLRIRYEDLVTDSAATVSRVASFAQVTLPADAATTHRPGSVGATTYDHVSWGSEHRTKAMQPVSSASIDSWQTSLSPLQIAMIDMLTADSAGHYGYAPYPTGIAANAVRDAVRAEQRRYHLSRVLPAARSHTYDHPRFNRLRYRMTGTTSDPRRASPR